MQNLIRVETILIMASSVILSMPSAFAAGSDETAASPEKVSGKAPASSQSHQECKVTCVNPHAACKESEKVLEVLQTLVKALNNADWKTYGENLDDHCFTFDEGSHKMISGRENVVKAMQSMAAKYTEEGAPFQSVTIDQPYAKVFGDTAVVTFVAIRQFGGKHPYKEEAQATDVFVKKDGSWKKCHFRGVWKRA
jgi:hypothetical protein